MAVYSLKSPKLWSLGKKETVNTFNNWRQVLMYNIQLDTNFAQFVVPGCTWTKQGTANPTRGLTAITGGATAAQQLASLELMLGMIANYVPTISRTQIIRSCTSLNSVWSMIRLHYGIEVTGGHFLDFAMIRLEPDESPEDLFQRLQAFVDDNLLTAGSCITHHDEKTTNDEEVSPSMENFIVLRWLELINPNLPKLIRQRYGTELRTRTLASIKSEISQSLPSLLDELHTSEEVRVMRANIPQYSSNSNNRNFANTQRRSRPQNNNRSGRRNSSKKCPLCAAAGRPDSHYLSKCRFLPESDRKQWTRAQQVSCLVAQTLNLDMDESSQDESDSDHEDSSRDHISVPAPSKVRAVTVKESPWWDAYSQNHKVRLTMDCGATANMIRRDVAQRLKCKILPARQNAQQADGSSELDVVGETSICITRDQLELHIDALVVSNLGTELLASNSFLAANDITLRPAKHQIIFGDGSIYTYGRRNGSSLPVARSSAVIVRGPPKNTTVLPGEFIEITLPSDVTWPDGNLALEPRIDSPCSLYTPDSQMWPPPSIVPALSGKIRIPNNTRYPIRITKNEHFCQVRAVTTVKKKNYSSPSIQPDPKPKPKPKLERHSDKVSVDPDNLLDPKYKEKFERVNEEYDDVFDKNFPGYNGKSGAIEGVVNMGPTQPPQRKGHCPQYARDRLVDLQAKADELEELQVLDRPENLGITVENLNPSFLIRKANGIDDRFVTSFGDVARYSKPQPSLMPDVDSTLRKIGQWKYMIKTDLTKSFYQIPLSRRSMKYCGVATPYKGIRVYKRCVMGLPGSETALEELMSRVVGDLLMEGCVAKIADDLFCGAETVEELVAIWRRVLHAFAENNLRLSATKTIICPRSTTVLGWIWSAGSLSASPHRISALSIASMPDTVKAMRSFVGAYKVLARVLPSCAHLLAPLEDSVAGKVSQSKIEWNDDLRLAFKNAQDSLRNHTTITTPMPSDQLWIVTDGSTKMRGLGGTLYVTRNNRAKVSGFFSAKLRDHQPFWLPCEVEAASISACVKHWSPYIIQSKFAPCVLTDSKPCAQAYEKLCRGQFSMSHRVTTFLNTVCRYQASVRHLPGAANVPSDFASRNAAECHDPTCQICSFTRHLEHATVLHTKTVEMQAIMRGDERLPFTSRTPWLKIQPECQDLRRTKAHLSAGTRPSKKQTKIKDVKRYLQKCKVAKDGLVVVDTADPLGPARELIVVPRNAVDGLLTSLHFQLSHPTKHQLNKTVRRFFYALDFDAAIHRASESCYQCTAIKAAPHTVTEQTSRPPPDTIGVSLAADVLRRQGQAILICRETVSSYTSACIVPDERHESLRDGLIRLCSPIVPRDGPPAVVRVDPAPGFQSLKNDKYLRRQRITIEIGEAKNINKNPVAERAIQEFELETLKVTPYPGLLSEADIAIIIGNLNARLRDHGISSRETMTQRDQFTGDQIPLSDKKLIQDQHAKRLENHRLSEKSKTPSPCLSYTRTAINVGDLIYLHSERDKHRARPRYMVVARDNKNCTIHKFIGNQLRAAQYSVKLSDCYHVSPSHVTTPERHDPRRIYDSASDDDYSDVNEKSREPDTETRIPPLPAVPETINSPAETERYRDYAPTSQQNCFQDPPDVTPRSPTTDTTNIDTTDHTRRSKRSVCKTVRYTDKDWRAEYKQPKH